LWFFKKGRAQIGVVKKAGFGASVYSNLEQSAHICFKAKNPGISGVFNINKCVLTFSLVNLSMPAALANRAGL
jgi:hypothetical protein